jgi:hypothetical protein
MKVIISVVAIGAHYPRAAARMIERFNAVSPGYEIQAWVNTLPPGAPRMMLDGYDYGPYAAKPFALEYARRCGATQAILLDAAFFPIRSILPMVEHIQRNGYYLCRNGFRVGEWCSDACLNSAPFRISREAAFEMDEISSYAVGLDFSHEDCCRLLDAWTFAATDPACFPGPHTNIGHPGRNQGFVSSDPRVKGHRHDQTALSIIANRLGMDRLSERPFLTAYQRGYGGAFPNESTVLVNHGVIDGWTKEEDLRS